MGYRQVQVISGRGTEPGQFAESLRGIAVDGKDLLYAVGDREVKVFDHQGGLRQRWTTAKPGYCVAAYADQALAQGTAVYVGEESQVEQFDGAGKLVATLRDDRLGVVTAIGLLGVHPRTAESHRRDAGATGVLGGTLNQDLLMADATQRCLCCYDRQGKWLNDIGKDNNTRGFLIPNGHLDFSVDAAGVIRVANPGKHRVERYSLTGELLGHFGKFGMQRPEDFPGCCNPTNLALTQQGDVVVTEKAPPRMKRYDADGKLLALVGPEAFDPNCKNMDVAVDLQGQVYVADTVRLHICVFAPEDGARAAATGPAASAVEAKP